MKTILILGLALSLILIPFIADAKQVAKSKPTDKGNLLSSLGSVEGNRNLINVAIMLTILAFAPAVL